MRLSRGLWLAVIGTGIVAALAYVAVAWPYVPATQEWRTQRRNRQLEQARELARRLAAQRPLEVRPGASLPGGLPRGGLQPAPLVYASAADYPSESVVHQAFWRLPLWYAFANHYVVRDAQRLRPEMVREMKRQARKLGLNGRRLGEVLEFLFRDKANGRNALLPVYAEHARYRGEPVWIVVLAWENAAAPARLGHIRVYVVSDGRNEIQFFQTCS